MSVNVSMRQLEEPGFADCVTSVLDATGVAPGCLVLEVTESILAEAGGDASEVLASLRLLGVQVALDDFGTGFSSFSALCRLPIDILKIDRSFVSGPDAGPGEALLVTVVAMAQRLGLDVIPEGIEEPRPAVPSAGDGLSLRPGLPARPPRVGRAPSRRCWSPACRCRMSVCGRRSANLPLAPHPRPGDQSYQASIHHR